MGVLLFDRQIVDSRSSRVLQFRKFGINPAAGTTAAMVWPPGGAYTGFLTAADTVRVAAGGNAADTAAGANALSVYVEGIVVSGGVWSIDGETLTLAGASASASTTKQFIRVFRAYVVDVGTYGVANAGDITIETTSGTNVAFITAGVGQTEQVHFTVPDGYQAHVKRISASSETAKPVNFRGLVRTDADNTVTNIRPARIVFRRLSVESEFSEEFTTPDTLPARADFWVETIKPSAGTANVYCELDIELIRQD